MNGHWTYPLRIGETLNSNEWIEWKFNSFLTSRFRAYCLRGGEAGCAAGFRAVLLWSESYRQDPAGTLPDDDVELAQLAGFGTDVESWQAVREAALYGWTSCLCEDEADGKVRLGHETIAAIAVASYRRKAGKAAGRKAGQSSLDRSRVKKQLQKIGAAKQADDPNLVSAIAEWLQTCGLWITEENVARGFEVHTGISVLRVVTGGKAKTFQ